MKDPYILKNGTLKNLLGIDDYEELKRAEKDIGFIKLINAKPVFQKETNIQLIKDIHKHIFSDIYDWAGEFRTVPVYKEEVVISRLSLEYSKPEDIEKNLNIELNKLNDVKWNELNIDEITKRFTNNIAKIWRVHPFRDGNTRTTLTFANFFAKQHGFPMDMGSMLDLLARKYDENGKIIQYSLRDMFVLASLDEKDYPEPEALEHIIKCKGINKKMDKLKNILER